MLNFDDLLGILEEGDFEEKPVTAEEFVTSEDYLNQQVLSEYQYQLIKAATQIYKKETLLELYGVEEGMKRWSQTCNEVIMMLGKGCHAPYTPIFNPANGKWERLDSFTVDGTVISSDGESHFATEAFYEGTGEMVRVKTWRGFEEDVYVGHKYLTDNGFVEVSNLQPGDTIKIGCNFDVDNPVDISVDHANFIRYIMCSRMYTMDGQEYISFDDLEYADGFYDTCVSLGETPGRFVSELSFQPNGIIDNLLDHYGRDLWITRKFPDELMNSSNAILSIVHHNILAVDREQALRVSARLGTPGIISASFFDGPVQTGNVADDQIVSITPLGIGPYWTRTVPDTGNYIGNGLISANSGKDFSSTIACAYLVYLLLCLKSPARYFGKPDGDSIDILNIAVNAQQANNVFFKGFANKIERSPWFRGKYTKKNGHFEFDKGINVYSGHSEREAWEGYNCATESAEALTKSGWKTYDQLSIGEEIYTIDHETGAGEWNEIEHLLVKDVDEELVEYKSRSFYSLTTKDHRWPVISVNDGSRGWKTSDTLTGEDWIMTRPSSVSELPTEPKHSDELVELIAWYMTEGFMDSRHCEIYQSHVVNPEYCKDIERALTGVLGSSSAKIKKNSCDWRINVRKGKGLTEFKIGIAAARKYLEPHAPSRIPTYEFINSLTKEQLNIFTETCMKGDNRGERYFAQKNYEMADIFAYAKILSGEAVSYRDAPVTGRDYKMNNITLRKAEFDGPVKPTSHGGIPKKSYVKYQGKVWCPTVRNGTWLVREKGSVHFTGNCMFVVLDEISGFALESNSGSETGKTAEAIYNMYRASVDSRFPDFGKVVLLSFPRYKNDFISQRYNAVISDKEVVTRSHKFKIDPELADGIEGNEFVIEWPEDHIVSYKIPRVFALKRPTWEVNPTRKIEDFTTAFYSNPTDALSRFACCPPEAVSAFFKDRQKIETAFRATSSLKEDNSFRDTFLPDPSKRYYVHVDLARVHDHAAVAMAHVDKWEQRHIGNGLTEPAPVVIVDQVRYWTPSKTKNVDFSEIREYILSLKRRGFDIRKVTFDRWESADTMKYLAERGLSTERLSVAKKHYSDFAIVVAEERVVGPNIELLINELLELKITNNDKVDHPRKGCFVADTEVRLADRSHRKIALTAEQDVRVLSCTESGTEKIGAARGRYTKHVDLLIDVNLSNGYSHRCTPDHRWMLSNGKYREAELLSKGNQLMTIDEEEVFVDSVVWVKLDKEVPVYDLEVDEWNNFTLNSGVVVHNSKDLSDAVCGAIYNSIAHTPRNINEVIEVRSLSSYASKGTEDNIVEETGIIRAPGKKRAMPQNLEHFLSSIKTL